MVGHPVSIDSIFYEKAVFSWYHALHQQKIIIFVKFIVQYFSGLFSFAPHMFADANSPIGLYIPYRRKYEYKGNWNYITQFELSKRKLTLFADTDEENGKRYHVCSKQVTPNIFHLVIENKFFRLE